MKISQLPELAAPTGAESVVVLDDGVTKRAGIGALARAAVAPAVEAAQAVARDLDAALGDLTYPVEELLGAPDHVDAGNGALGNTYLREQRARSAGTLTKVQLFAKSTGTLKIKRFSVAVDGTYDETGSATAAISAVGVTTLTPADFGAFPVAAGEVLGFFSADVGVTFGAPIGVASEDPLWASIGGDQASGKPTPFDARLEFYIGFTITHQVVAATPAAIAALQAASADATAKLALLDAALLAPIDELLGSPSHIESDSGALNNTYFREQPATHDGLLTKVQMFAKGAGTLKIKRFSVAGDGSYHLIGSTSAAVAGAGAVTLTPADFGTFPVAAGEVLGLFSADVGMCFGGPVDGQQNPRWASLGGDAPGGQPAPFDTGVEFYFGFTITHQAVTLPSSAPVAPSGGGGGVVQQTPDLLVPSSYDLIIGRPLKLLRDGMTSYREEIGYDIGATGSNGDRVGCAFAAPVMALDGAEFSGAGYIWAKPKGEDTVALFRTPVTFFSAPPTRKGAFRYLQIGDSLTNRGTTAALQAKFTALGVPATLVGTLADAGGAMGEGRPNWKATDYTYATIATDASGGFYAVHPLRPNGGSGLSITATLSNGSVATATASGGIGYPDGDWPVVFGWGSNAGVGRAARATIHVAGGVPGAITITDAGAGYDQITTDEGPNPHIVPSYAEYLTFELTGAYGQRWHYNPFLRKPTAAELSANDPRIQNGWMFDYGFYVANLLGGVAPDQLVVMLGMNDFLKGNTPAQAFAAIQQIVASARAFSATLPIAIAVVGHANTLTWTLFVELWKLLSAQYRGQEAAHIYLRPVFQVIDDKFAYSNDGWGGMQPSAIDARTGMQTVIIPDGTHFDAVGRSQAAEMLLAWSVNRMSS